MRANPVDELVFQCKAAGLGEPRREVYFHESRRWRFDLAFCAGAMKIGGRWIALTLGQSTALAIEVDGGVYVQGRHSRGKGIEADMEKIATAMTMGWRVLRVTPRHIREGKALNWIEALLK